MIPSNVTHVTDANVVHLENEVPFNGSFRIFVFGGLQSKSSSHEALANLAAWLQQEGSFYDHLSHAKSQEEMQHETDNPHSRFFTICLVLAARRADIEISNLPPLFRDYRDHIYADDITETRVPDAEAVAHSKMGLENGDVIVLRPDGHVGCVVALEQGRGTVDALEAYFGAFTTKGSTVSSNNPDVPKVPGDSKVPVSS